MTTTPRRLSALAGLVVPLLLLSCGKKDQPAQQETTREATPPTLAPPTTLPLPTPSPTPPPVWREARWGMTKKELLAAFGGEARRLPAGVPFTQPQEGSSMIPGTSDLAISEYEMEGTRFRVLFGFEADALNRIHLAAAKAGEATCYDLEQLLTKEHSEPAHRRSTGTTLRGEEIVWKRPDQTIVLACAGVRSLGFQSVALDYTPPGAEVAAR